jgi:hypothetical protein
MPLASLCLYLLVQSPAAPLPVSSTISEATGGIRAEIRSGAQVPMAGVLILLKGREGGSWITRTDANGRFLAGGLPPGDYQIECRLPDFKGESRPIQIKAQAWLLGVPAGAASSKPAAKELRFHGPAIYLTEPSLITPQKRPELGKIPMH